MTVEEKKIDKIKEILTKVINRDNTREGQYTIPYGDSDDEYFGWKIEFKVKRISIWPEKSEHGCKYSGTIYIRILDINVTDENGITKTDYNMMDLPDWIFEDIIDDILEYINKFMPIVCVDITFD